MTKIQRQLEENLHHGVADQPECSPPDVGKQIARRQLQQLSRPRRANLRPEICHFALSIKTTRGCAIAQSYS